MYQRRVDPIRQSSPVVGQKRRRLEREYAQLQADIDDLDRQLRRLSLRRRALGEQRRSVHRRLWVNLARRGRRAAPDGREALPPLSGRASMLWGRRLRAACLAILARRGPLPLVEIHAELHRLGYGIAQAHPVKTLADALGYEADQGRVVRVERGTYRLSPATQLRTVG